MKKIIHSLLYKERLYAHPTNGSELYMKSRRFPPQRMLNLCLWDGARWHQAPLHLWEDSDSGEYMEAWVIGLTSHLTNAE